MRMRRKPWTEVELAACPWFIERPSTHIGQWRSLFSKDRPVHLEIGYDRPSVDDGSWKGKVREDYYGRRVPAGAKGTFRLSSFTSSGRKIREAVLSIYDRETDPALFVRRLTLTALHVMPEEEAVFQLDLFTDQAAEDREKKLQQTMLEVRRRFGANALVRGMNLKEGATGMDRNRQIGGHKA